MNNYQSKIKSFTIHHSQFTILLLFAYMLIAKNASAQSTNYDRNSPAYKFLERWEIKSGNLNNQLFLDAGAVTRKNVNQFIEKNTFPNSNDSVVNSQNAYIYYFNKADHYWHNYYLADNLPWSVDSTENDSNLSFLRNDDIFQSKKPILRHFYKTKANLLEAHTEGFDVFINPVLAFEIGKETDSANYRFRNTRGLEIRGQIGQKVGFYTYLTENQVGFPGYIQQFYRKNKVLPGEGFWKDFKGKYTDFFSSRAYITFSPIKQIHFQFGNDKNFIGSGYRSLLLSDFSKDYLQLKVTTRVWRFQYQNIFAEMTNYVRSVKPYPKKYAAFHYLSFDAARWANFGVFEGIMFYDNKNTGRGFDFNYLNPVIFYRSVEHNLGSPDNALLGANANFLVAKRVKLYGQLLFDEFKVHELVNSKGWWGNKYGVQAGFKWVDFLGLPNVDLQSEFNLIRPYTYSSDTSAKAFSHFHQPLAHPLGANLQEFINILNINTFGPLNIQLKYAYIQQGQDSGKLNYGSDIYLSYNTLPNQYGNEMLQGLKTTINFAEIMASYQLKHNLFIDLNLLYRSQKNELTTLNTMFYGAGIRLNFNKPDYTF